MDGIADRLGTKWPKLARKLNLSKKVDSIREDHRGDTHEQAVKMLVDWKQRYGAEAKIKIIVEALREINLKEIADFILSNCRASENATDSQ